MYDVELCLFCMSVANQQLEINPAKYFDQMYLQFFFIVRLHMYTFSATVTVACILLLLFFRAENPLVFLFVKAFVRV
jgi:hypothetical protein